ncbi:MAG: dockerin type I domain-containing protein [Candidatus Zixiibacteriota bacterium]
MRIYTVVSTALLMVLPGLFSTPARSQDQLFVRGDVNADGKVDQEDVDMYAGYFNQQGFVTCSVAADVNGDGITYSMADYQYLVDFVSGEGPAPPLPYPDCGPDPTFPGSGMSCCSDVDCCGQYASGYTGNTDCSTDGERTLNDLTVLIDRVYISHEQLCCEANGNVDGSDDGNVTLNDITALIDYVYLSHVQTAACQ